jgi:hypothetical protein
MWQHISSVLDDEKWRRLWKLDVLPRVRVFWWRVLKGIISDYATLTRRHVRVLSTCPVCKSTSENLLHALVECSHAQQFWKAANDYLNIKLPRLHPNTWADDILCSDIFEKMDRTKIISIMSAIWDSRNRWSHDDQGYNPTKSVENVAETLVMLDSLKKKKVQIAPAICTWHVPEEGFIKLNSDGAIRKEDGVASSGGVARDLHSFMGAWCKIYRGITEPLVIETLALRDAIIFAKENQFGKIILENDCSEAVCLWKERHSQRAVIAPILKEIDELSTCFTGFSINFVHKSANSVAHECARFGCVHSTSMCWLGVSPQFLKHCIQAHGHSAVLS